MKLHLSRHPNKCKCFTASMV